MKEVRRFQRVLIVLFLTLNAGLLCSMKGFELSDVVQYSLITALLATGIVLFFSRRPNAYRRRK